MPTNCINSRNMIGLVFQIAFALCIWGSDGAQVTGTTDIIFGSQNGIRTVTATVSASSADTNSRLYPHYAFDGNPHTRWGAAPKETGAIDWIEIQFQEPQDIFSMDIVWEQSYASTYQVRAQTMEEDNSTNWVPLVLTTDVAKAGLVSHADDLLPAFRVLKVRIECLKRRVPTWGSSIVDISFNLNNVDDASNVGTDSGENRPVPLEPVTQKVAIGPKNAFRLVEASITASSMGDETLAPKRAFDGKARTRWAAAPGNLAGPDWIELAFSHPQTISSVGLWWEAAFAVNYRVMGLLENGPLMWDELVTVNDAEHGGNVIHTLQDPVEVRRIRIECLQRSAPRWGCSIFEVYFNSPWANIPQLESNQISTTDATLVSSDNSGTPIQYTFGHGNVVSAVVRASSSFSADTRPEFAFDGREETRWAARRNFHSVKDWIEIEFLQPQSIHSLHIHWEDSHASEYEVESLAVGRATYRILVPRSSISAGGKYSHPHIVETHNVTRVRIQCLKRSLPPWGPSVYEVRFNVAPEQNSSESSVYVPTLNDLLMSEHDSTKTRFGVAIPVAPRQPRLYIDEVLASIPRNWPILLVSRVKDEDLCAKYADRVQWCYAPSDFGREIHPELDNEDHLNENVVFGAAVFQDSQERARWRSHLVLDCAMTLEAAAEHFQNFLYLEDDVALTEAGVIQINNILKESQNQHIRWPLSRLSVGGMLGILYDSRIVPAIVEHFRARFDEKPADWLLLTVKNELHIRTRTMHSTGEERSKLLHHLGEYSTFNQEIRSVDRGSTRLKGKTHSHSDL